MFVCVTHDTRREVEATAARLRPMGGTAAVKRAAPAAPRPWTLPEGLESTYRVAVPVVGLAGRVSRLPVMNITATDADAVNRIVDRMHCAETAAEVCRRIRRALASKWQWRTIPAELRRSILLAGLERHAVNRRLYRDVMGHGPLPSERRVAEAVGVACGLGRMPT